MIPDDEFSRDGARLAQREAITRAVLEKFIAYWSVQDVTQTVALLAEDAVSQVYFNHPEVGMAGEKRGQTEIAEGLYENQAIWVYLQFEPVIVGIDDDTGRIQIQFEYEHQKTHLRYAGTMRMVLRVRDGLISRIDCYHDGERVAAFMELLRASGGGAGFEPVAAKA